MSKWIRLEGPSGDPVVVNSERVIGVTCGASSDEDEDDCEEVTHIWMDVVDGAVPEAVAFEVSATVDEVLELLREAEDRQCLG